MCMSMHACLAWHTVTSDQSPLAFPVLWLYWGILLHRPSWPGVYCVVLVCKTSCLFVCSFSFYVWNELEVMKRILTLFFQTLSQQSTAWTKWLFSHDSLLQENKNDWQCCHVVGVTMCTFCERHQWVAPKAQFWLCVFCMFLAWVSDTPHVWSQVVVLQLLFYTLWNIYVRNVKSIVWTTNPFLHSCSFPHRGHHLWVVTVIVRPLWQTPWQSILMPVRWLCVRAHQRQRLRMNPAWVTSPPPATRSLRRDIVSIYLLSSDQQSDHTAQPPLQHLLTN